jgi:tRNA A-37 threonylcarbamoyl transferase component Bud32
VNNPRSTNENTVVCPVCGLELPARLKKCPQDGVVLKATLPPDPLVNTVIGGRYEILSVVGRGGMSVVYKARNKAVGSIVAVKTLKHDLISDEELFARFCQEAKAVQLLIHANIVTVHEFGVTLSGQPFIVMDFLAGQTLGETIDDLGRLPVKRTLKIFIQVCDALSHAHAHKIIHRDIKPGNIMLVQTTQEDDFVKLFDFGFAKLLPQTGLYVQQLTQTGDVLGTPLYMSPEQSKGKSLDSRSDIYSVGCVMYEAITGKAPLVGDNVLDTMQKQINERPESLDTARPDLYIPDHLTTILFRTLEKDPDQRYQSMNDLKRDLELIYNGLSGKVTLMPGMLPGLAKLKQMPTQPTWFLSPMTMGLALGAVALALLTWVVVQLSGGIHLEIGQKPAAAIKPTYTGGPDVVWAKYRQAGMRALDKNRYAEAEDLFNLSLGEADRTDSCEAHSATNFTDLARAYVRGKKLSEAEKACGKALNIRHGLHETNERPIADIFAVYAEIYLARENFKDADTYLQKALAIQQRELGPTHPDVAATINQLGRASEGQQNWARAEAYYKQALSIRTSSLGPNNPALLETLNDYTRLLKRTNRAADAEKMEMRAKAIRPAVTE